MWRLSPIVAIAVLFAAATAVADDELPFEAYVVPTEAEVFSAPDEPRYVTHAIPRGTKVEVYERREEWFAIRPPEGSFSWVPSASVTMTDEPGVAEASSDGVASWIGSAVERVKKHQSSVQLKKGERVDVMGKKEVENADGQREIWLKIAPPAGEFRWIHASQVSRDAPAAFIVLPPERGSRRVGRARPASADPPGTDASTWVGRRPPPADWSHPTPETDDRQSGSQSYTSGPSRRSMELRDLTPPVRHAAFQEEKSFGLVQQAAHETQEEPPPARTPSSPDGFVPRKARAGQTQPLTSSYAALPPLGAPRQAHVTPTKRTVPQSTTPSPTPAESAVVVTETSSAGIASATVQRRLEEIDVALSLMVSQDRSQWNLGLLKREVERLVEQGATPVDRGEARFMLEKIERFGKAFGVEEDDGATLELPIGSIAARKAALAAATAPKYDGIGYLTAVRAAKPVAPYALLDQDGKRICYVTPVPGFNLREYENRKIGVFGKRGYVPDANAPHLLAERVVDLDKQVR